MNELVLYCASSYVYHGTIVFLLRLVPVKNRAVLGHHPVEQDKNKKEKKQ